MERCIELRKHLSVFLRKFMLSRKSDPSGRRDWIGRHEFTDCFENHTELLVVLLFQFIEPAS